MAAACGTSEGHDGETFLPSPCKCPGNVSLQSLEAEFELRRVWDGLVCSKCEHFYEPRVAAHLGKVALREVIKEHGPTHSRAADMLIQIGNAYGQFGEAEHQREYLERALDIGTSRYDVFVDIGKAYGKLGHLGKQREFLEHAVAMIEQQWGSSHEDLAPVFVLLGDLYSDVKVSVDWSENWMTSLQEQLLKYASARNLTVAALTGTLSITDRSGKAVPVTTQCDEGLAISFDDQGQASAKVVHKKLPVFARNGHRASAPGRIDFFEHSPLRSEQGSKQYPMQRLSVPILQAENFEDLLNCDNAAAASSEEDDSPCESASKPRLKQAEDPAHDASQDASEFFPLSFVASADAARQYQFYERALHIQESVYGYEHCELVVALTKLGNVAGRLGSVEKKYKLLSRALDIQEKELGSKHREVAVIRFNLAHAQFSLGDEEKALKNMRIAKSSMVANFGEKHGHTKAANRALKYWNQLRAKKQAETSST